MAIPKKKPKINSLPSLDLENEESSLVPLEEVLQEDETEEFIEEERVIKIPQREIPLDSKYSEIDNTNEFIDEKKEKQVEYIDKENKKIIPIGSSKAKIKDKDFDKRKNKIIGIKLFRFIVYIALFIVIILGVKKLIFPERVQTEEEIKQIAQLSIGKTGFPYEKGEAFARSFLKAYLDMSDTKASKQLINKYYTGKLGSGDSLPQTGRSGKFSGMKVVGEPVLFDSKLVTKTNATYSYSVYLTNVDGSLQNELTQSTGQWLSFLINVYYDIENKAVSIVEQPTLIPSYVIQKPNRQLKPLPLGNGETDDKMESVLQPTINGFLKAYANVDINNYEEILQYIPKDKPTDLISGFGGLVQIKNNNIQKRVFKTKDENEWKIDIILEWENRQAIENSLTTSYLSHYVMTIRKTGESVFLVTKFTPYTFVE